MSFEFVLSISFFCQFVSSGLEGPVGVVSWIRRMLRCGLLVWRDAEVWFLALERMPRRGGRV